MSAVIMYGSAIIAVAVVIFMLIKKMDIKITLFLMGILLMFIGMAMGNGIGVKDFASTGAVWLDPLKAVADQFKDTLRSAGFIILILGGYSAYMSHIGANEVTVSVLTKPIKHIKSAYILVPVVFLLGNLLSLVIPSASNLAIILLATLFPVLVQSGMSSPDRRGRHRHYRHRHAHPSRQRQCRHCRGTGADHPVRRTDPYRLRVPLSRHRLHPHPAGHGPGPLFLAAFHG